MPSFALTSTTHSFLVGMGDLSSGSIEVPYLLIYPPINLPMVDRTSLSLELLTIDRYLLELTDDYLTTWLCTGYFFDISFLSLFS
jgi:hypothetical protein